MRPAEVCGLRWAEDVNLNAQTLRVWLTRTLVNGQVEEKEPKSQRGKRTLPLPSPVVTALTTFKALQAAEKLAAGAAYADTGYVLVDELGRPWKTDQLRRAIYKLMAHAGVRKVRLYDARHACLTYLATSGVPDVVVSAWAGHADLSFTKRTYVHPNPNTSNPPPTSSTHYSAPSGTRLIAVQPFVRNCETSQSLGPTDARLTLHKHYP
jgi:integrase